MINYFFVIDKRSVYRGHTLVQWYMVSAFKFGNQSLQKKLEVKPSIITSLKPSKYKNVVHLIPLLEQIIL